MSKHLTSFQDVIDALGGRQGVADIVGVQAHTLSSWKLRSERFPCATYKAMIDALPEGVTADPALWGMIPSKDTPKGRGRVRQRPKTQATPERRVA